MVTSGFGIRRGVMHKGVDIAAPEGTPVHAADAGVVIFVGRLPGYGNTVIIRHSGNYVTIYAHDCENVVRAGQSVSCGEVIGAIGTSGRATGPIFILRCAMTTSLTIRSATCRRPDRRARRDLPAMNPIPRVLTPSVVFGASPGGPE
jgi:Peptidase family M23